MTSVHGLEVSAPARWRAAKNLRFTPACDMADILDSSGGCMRGSRSSLARSSRISDVMQLWMRARAVRIRKIKQRPLTGTSAPLEGSLHHTTDTSTSTPPASTFPKRDQNAIACEGSVWVKYWGSILVFMLWTTQLRSRDSSGACIPRSRSSFAKSSRNNHNAQPPTRLKRLSLGSVRTTEFRVDDKITI